jgi:hypothetical protein
MAVTEKPMIELTPEQREELTQPEPTVVDPTTKEEYILVRKEVSERLRAALVDEFQVPDAYPAIDRAFAPGWDDQKMDDYDRYEELRG